MTAGLARSESIRDIIAAIKASAHGAVLNMPEVIPYEQFDRILTGNRLRAFQNSSLNILLKTYSPYVSFERDFVVDDTAALLAAHGIVMTPVMELLPALCGFALATNFTIDTQLEPQAA